MSGTRMEYDLSPYGWPGKHMALAFCSALSPRLMAEMERTFNVPVIEAYGMTEASHQITSNPLPPGKRKPGSVGVAAGAEVAVMGDAGRLLAAGKIGEIVIRGDNVVRAASVH